MLGKVRKVVYMDTKSVIVTGGAKGIGRAICLRLAKSGYQIAVNYASSASDAENLVSQIEDFGVKAVAIKADVSKFEEAEALVRNAKEALGDVYGLVNNAGITKDGLLARMKEEDIDSVIDTNLKGAFYCLRHACPLMMRSRQGRIVNISSIAGVMGNAGQANYSAAKAGMIGLTKSAAKELAGRNVCVNAIAPGLVETDMTAAMPERARQALLERVPLGRMGKPDEIAAMVEFLLGENAGYITGQVIVMDGGLCM